MERDKAQGREKDESAAPNQENEINASPQLTKNSFADEMWAKGGDINDIARFSGPRDERFRTMTDFLIRAIHSHHLLAAAESGDAKMIKELDNRSVDVNRTNRKGETALHVAVQVGNRDALLALIQTDKVLLNQENGSGMTALDFAARRNRDDPSDYTLVRDLLLAGARPDPESSRDFESGWKAPTTVAPSQRSSRELMNELLQNPPPRSPPRSMKRLMKESPFDDSDARNACRKTEVLVAEMFSTGSYFPYYTNIERLIYETDAGDQKPEEKGLKATLDKYFLKQLQREIGQGNTSLGDKPAVCRWYHIPMNNVRIPPFFT